MEPGTTYVQKLPSGKVGFVRRPIKIKPTKSILADAFLPNRDGPAWTPPYTCNLDPPPTDTIDLKDANRSLPLMEGPSQSYHHCRECQLAARKYDPNHTVRHTLGFMLLQRQRQDIGVPYVDGIARLHTNIDIRSYQARYLPLVCVTGDLEGESVVEGGVAVRDSVLIRSLPFNPLRPLKYYFKLLLKPVSLNKLLFLLLPLRCHLQLRG
ncbi:hypothetical protein MferCBS31731_003461 [Microsporum ferrugineum]